MRCTKTLRSLAKGIYLQFLFADDRPNLSLGEIALALGLPKSTAHLPDAFLERCLRERGLCALTPHIVTSAPALRSLLGRIRRQGYAVTYQQALLGARGVAVPICDHRGRAIGSLEVSGPTPRFSHREALGLVPRLRQCGQALSAALGAEGSVAARCGTARPVRGATTRGPMPTAAPAAFRR